MQKSPTARTPAADESLLRATGRGAGAECHTGALHPGKVPVCSAHLARVNLPSLIESLAVFKTTTRSKSDWITPIALFCLSCIGIAFIYSATYSGGHGVARGFAGMVREEWFKQIIFLALGTGIYITVSLIDYRFWLSVAHWVYAICLIPLFLVLIPGVSGGAAQTWGAQRWIDLGFFK
jgi:rod shape determining protein RodA